MILPKIKNKCINIKVHQAAIFKNYQIITAILKKEVKQNTNHKAYKNERKNYLILLNIYYLKYNNTTIYNNIL